MNLCGTNPAHSGKCQCQGDGESDSSIIINKYEQSPCSGRWQGNGASNRQGSAGNASEVDLRSLSPADALPSPHHGGRITPVAWPHLQGQTVRSPWGKSCPGSLVRATGTNAQQHPVSIRDVIAISTINIFTSTSKIAWDCQYFDIFIRVYYA